MDQSAQLMTQVEEGKLNLIQKCDQLSSRRLRGYVLRYSTFVEELTTEIHFLFEGVERDKEILSRMRTGFFDKEDMGFVEKELNQRLTRISKLQILLRRLEVTVRSLLMVLVDRMVEIETLEEEKPLEESLRQALAVKQTALYTLVEQYFKTIEEHLKGADSWSSGSTSSNST